MRDNLYMMKRVFMREKERQRERDDISIRRKTNYMSIWTKTIEKECKENEEEEVVNPKAGRDHQILFLRSTENMNE